MTDDQLFLANGLIDDELDAHQRELAEADPDVMREVAALRAQRAQLRDVAPASDATRSAALAAALDAWAPVSDTVRDRSTPAAQWGPPAAATASGASVTPLQPRPPTKSASQHRSRWTRANGLLGAAAAIVGLGIAGLVISRGLENQASDKAATSATRNLPTESRLESDDAEPPPGRSAAPADNDSASAPEAAMSSAAMESSTEYSLDAMSASEDLAMASAASDVLVVPLPTLLFSEQDLKDAVESLRTTPSTNATSDDAVLDDVLACDIPLSISVNILGETTASNDDPERPAVRLIIVTDEAGNQAYAVDTETCLAVQSVNLYP